MGRIDPPKKKPKKEKRKMKWYEKNEDYNIYDDEYYEDDYDREAEEEELWKLEQIY